jgi:hypothetical protein
MGELEKRQRLEALADYENRLNPAVFGEGICEDELLEDSDDDDEDPVEKPMSSKVITGKLWELRDIVANLVGIVTLLVKEES